MQTTVFVSHVSEEEAVATALKRALDADFLGLVRLFISSDGESIAAGKEWLEALERTLDECALMISFCSPISIGRPWLAFEAGYAWSLNKPIIPVCHGGLTPQDLPMPLSLRQGLILTEASGLARLYTGISEVVQCNS